MAPDFSSVSIGSGVTGFGVVVVVVVKSIIMFSSAVAMISIVIAFRIHSPQCDVVGDGESLWTDSLIVLVSGCLIS